MEDRKLTDKIKGVQQFAKDLAELSEVYTLLAANADRLEEKIVNELYKIAEETNNLHEGLLDGFI